MKFNVTIQRTEYREHTFRVDAKDSNDAFYAGLDAASNYDFRDSPITSADEDVIAVQNVG